ncbi:MAG: C10 family peptidase, partial [Bacteroidota bacterium]
EKFPLDRSTYPNGLVEWLVNSKDFIKHVRQNTREQTPQVARAWRLCDIQQRLTGRPPDPCDDGNGGGCQNQYTTIGPLLSTVWGQWGVYNDLAPDLDCGGDGRAPTGCVATAMAQIMKFHEFPNRYNWDNMPDLSGTMETARLMRDAGDAVNMDWGCNGSGADTRGEVASSFVHDFGYSSASYADFNRETVKQQLRWNRPVILRGGRKSGWWIFGTYADGHAWVCDGYRSSFFCETGTGYLYLHMNWGWSSTQLNGWFAFNNWNPSNHTFNYKRGMVYNIRP